MNADIEPRWLRRLSLILGSYALVGGLISFSGWAFDIPRLTDWLQAGISIQPNTTVLIALAGSAILALQFRGRKYARAVGYGVAIFGGLNLLQYITGIDFGFNHQLLFGREWGSEATVTPGRFGPPASISFVLIGMGLILITDAEARLRRYVPYLALFVMVITLFSLLGYLFGARNFYAIPWLSAIALQTGTMLMALALALIVNVPEHHPMLLLGERSSAGNMARTVLPALAFMIPLITWFRIQGQEGGLFDLGTGRALGAATLMLCTISLMWVALLALRRRELREREADQRKDEFLATLAHELRNPLAPISNATSILKLGRGKQELTDRALATIERQMSHMVRLVDDLLDLSRIGSGKLELRRERLDLRSVIHQALEICEPLAESANLSIHVEMPSQPIYLLGDPVRLSQVVGNLLNNACKFTPENGRIHLLVDPRDTIVMITVRDEGIGIPPDRIDSIFEMFSQVDQTLERSHGGLGIGLTLTQRLVKLHGGSIEAASEGPGTGSTFTVRLPLLADQTPPVTATGKTSPSEATHHILVVDDNIDSATSLAAVLQLSGHETALAHDGEQAVSAADEQRPDVILLDIGLPKLNGYEACRRIREFPWARETLILALTGWGQAEDRRKSTEAGFDGHFVKPVKLEELMAVLARAPSRPRP